MIFALLQFIFPLVTAITLRKRRSRVILIGVTCVGYVLTFIAYNIHIHLVTELTDNAGALGFFVIFGGWFYPLVTASLFLLLRKLHVGRRFKPVDSVQNPEPPTPR